jgi:hypothetical protein
MPSFLRDIRWAQMTRVYSVMTLTIDQATFFLPHLTGAITATFEYVYGMPVTDSVAQRSSLLNLKTLTVNSSEISSAFSANSAFHAFRN